MKVKDLSKAIEGLDPEMEVSIRTVKADPYLNRPKSETKPVGAVGVDDTYKELVIMDTKSYQAWSGSKKND